MSTTDIAAMSTNEQNETELNLWKPIHETTPNLPDGYWCIRDGNDRLICDFPDAPDSEENAKRIAELYNEQLAMVARPADPVTVMLYGWTRINGEKTYAEELKAIEGWEVYTRIPLSGAKHDQFDVTDEEDFTNYEEARAAAERRASELNCEIDEY